MKITNKIRFAAITLLLLAGSATQALAENRQGPWKEEGLLVDWFKSPNSKISYNDLYLNAVPTEWNIHYVWSDNDGYGYSAGVTTCTDKDVFRYSILSTFQNVEAYTKVTYKWNFTLRWSNATNTDYTPFVYNYLYLFETLNAAKTTGLSLSASDYGTGYRCLGGGVSDREKSSGLNTDIVFDNSTGEAAANIYKYLVQAARTQRTQFQVTLDKRWWFGCFRSDSYTLTSTSYFKYVTFDANGGTGTAMAVQIVEENTAASQFHTLNANTYKRAGYEFVGWNTEADGSGTAYENQGMIDASSSDKGPVTLYAQWKPTAWTYTEQVKIGTVLIAETANGLSYDSHNPTQSWGGYYVTDMQGSGVTGDQGVMHKGTSILNTSQVSVSIYKQTKNIPAYSKFTRNASFAMYSGSSWAYEACGLYMFDDEFSAKYTILDVYRYQSNSYGNAYKIVKGYMEDASGTHHTWSGSKAITYDNSTGSSDKEISKYIDLVHSSLGNAGSTATCTQWVTWKETNSTNESWSYYKYFTFKKNDGTDTQVGDVITIENSGILSFPETPTLTGYKFVGWNTQADGKGTTYTNGQNITATLEDKGPVTLYAQWVVDVTVSESGSATIFADKNLVVPKGVQVYGFVYMDGALVQGAEISEGAILPAYNGYLVKAATAGTYVFALSSSAATAPTSDLTGTTAEINTPSGNVYVWGKPNGYNYGWYKYEGTTIPAGKAYFVAGSINGGINDMKINTDKDF